MQRRNSEIGGRLRSNTGSPCLIATVMAPSLLQSFFAGPLRIFRGCRVRGWYQTFLHVFPDPGRGAIKRDALEVLLHTHGFQDDAEAASREIIQRAQQNRRTGSVMEKNSITCLELLDWFREAVRPPGELSHSGATADSDLPPLRDLIHLLAHGHREQEDKLILEHRARRDVWAHKRIEQVRSKYKLDS